MNIIQITPPKQLNFTIPGDLHRVITLTNLTLHSLFVTILKSHPTQISLDHQSFLMQAFQQKKVIVALNWTQQSSNLSVGMLRVCYQDVEEEMNEKQLKALILSEKGKGYFQDLTVNVSLDTKVLQFLNYKQIQKQESSYFEQCSSESTKKYYLMQRISHLWQSKQQQNMINTNQFLKNEILSFLQHLPQVMSIEPCMRQSSFLIEFSPQKQNNCILVQFVFDEQIYVYSIRRLVSYGTPQDLPHLISIDEQKLKKQIIPKKHSMVQSQVPQQVLKKQNIQSISPASKFNKQKSDLFKQEIVKQSFMHRRQFQKVKSKRRNKSQQKIIQNSSDEQYENELFKQQLQQIKKNAFKQNRIAVQYLHPQNHHKDEQIKYKQTDIQLMQKILNIYIQTKQHITQIYVILCDCVRYFVLEEPLNKKVLKFDAIYKENINMPTTVVKYKDQLIFGNQSYLFWVNTITGQNQWKYVQRKYIYSLAIIQELSLVAVGGKNFSKLSYFGKDTTRSNIKLYSCSSSDKHDHLFTYDIPGNNMGNVMNMDYVVVPPHGIKLLLVHTLNTEGKSHFHFFRVKAFNKIEVFGQVDLQELGILHLLKFKFNRQTFRIICMEALGDTDMDCFKKLKLKCQYEKVEVSTQGLKFPLKKYISFNLGGNNQSNNKQWMSLVNHDGTLFHLYNFQDGTTIDLPLGKSDIRQVFSVRNQRFVVICTDNSVRIRQRIEINEEMK